jgi:hypothetical protein
MSAYPQNEDFVTCRYIALQSAGLARAIPLHSLHMCVRRVGEQRPVDGGHWGYNGRNWVKILEVISIGKVKTGYV